MFFDKVTQQIGKQKMSLRLSNILKISYLSRMTARVTRCVPPYVVPVSEIA